MKDNSFNLGVVLLLFGQLLAQIVSGLSGEVIPANLLITVISFSISIVLILNIKYLVLPKANMYDLLYFFLIFSFLFSAYKYGQGSTSEKKIIGVFYLIILPCCIFFLLTLSIRSLDVYKLGMLARRVAIISIPIALIVFLSGNTHSVEGSDRVSITGVGNTIWFGRYLGLLIVVLVLTNSRKRSVVSILMIAAALYLMFASGARGPFVAMIAAIIFLKLNIKPRYLLLGLVFIIMLPYFIELTAAADYLLSNNDFSGFSRIKLITLSIELIKENPVTGIGFGNFGMYTYAFDDSINFYPHNILAEVFVECGFISFSILVLLIIRTFYLGSKNILITTVFIYTFVNSLFSGDVTGNSIFFTSMFLIRILSEKKLNNIARLQQIRG